ncbi:MAG: tetratricopeptide (TPR) repeat protein [Marivirga sp.]|jgi:tetratricopeptide (TPR) repeat protein
MRKYQKLILTGVLLFCNFFMHAQGLKTTSMADVYKEAQTYMLKNDYQEANLAFRKILKMGTKLPAEMPYLFAETLYNIGQYQNSKSFLEKYFEIMGKAGTYYEQAVHLQEKLALQLNEAISCAFCDYSGYRLQECDVCHGQKELLQTCNYCKGVGKVGCTLCAGEGVLVQIGALGNKRYKTCHQCSGEGIHSCNICEGEKEFYNYCDNCLGVGRTASSTICTHKALSK